MTISVGETLGSFNGGILSAILQGLTRYSANDLQFPVNDRSLFTGKSHAIGRADNIRGGWPARKGLRRVEERPESGRADGERQRLYV
jgi:hypothetical protein